MQLEELGAVPRAGPLGSLWELLFPSRCVGCGRRGVVLCAACRETVPWLPPTACPRCTSKSREGRICQRCDAPHLASIRAACTFDGVIRTAIHRLKFQQAAFLVPLLARVLALSLARRPLEADLLIAVPLSPGRRRERGFNQSELIAAQLARLTSLPAPSAQVLTRARDTPPQVGMSAAERRRNLRGAFDCLQADLVAGRRCVL